MSDTTTETITEDLKKLNELLAKNISEGKLQYGKLYEEINRLKESKIEDVRAAAGKNEEELKKLMAEKEVLTNSNTELKEKLKGLADINNQVDILRANVAELAGYNNTQAKQINALNPGVDKSGGYQYKSKSKKSNSKRMLKLNRFGLLKSRSKSKKSKKKLRPKKHKKGRRKSVKKGGMKRKSSKKNKKKTKKSKKKHTKRK